MIQGPAAADQGPGAAVPADRARLKETAEQFEALLIAQVMKAMRAAAGGFGETDAASESALGLAEEQFSRALAARGGLGLAALVMRGLQKAAAHVE